eukprot:TRINITY_DN3372_c0_g1_i6.p1 TRINITY_DN3372_c0_g1~~TRINITY_DN3372_c0_g1_i6.p1  ORF type:complete len:245 (-),score=56.06 TRINITY_DN3372_c0_g1_i6:96-830(-)
MTKSLLPPEVLDLMDPKYIAPLVGYLCHDSCNDSGEIFETGGAWISRVRMQRSQGVQFNQDITAEIVRDKFAQVTDYSKVDYPGENAGGQANPQTTQTQQASNEQSSQQEGDLSQWKSYQIFQMQKGFLEMGEGEKIVKNLQAIYNIKILEKKGKTKPVLEWIVDVKNGTGRAYLGDNKDADATFTMTDDDFFALSHGKLNPSQAFITNRMKIKGNNRKASAFTPDLFPKPTPENIAKYTKSKL